MHRDKINISSFGSKTLALWIVISLILVIEFCWLYCACAKTETLAKEFQLSEIEQRLFFREYSGEDESSRLTRIEKQVFGESQTGEVQARLANLRAALPRPAVPDKESTIAPVAAAGNQQPAVIGKSATNPSQSSPQSPALPFDAGSDNNDEEKLAVMAAKQQEIADLLAQGVALWKGKKAALALDKFAQVVRLDPQNAQAYFSIGVALEAQGDVTPAKDNYQKAHILEPDNKDYAVALAAIEQKVVVKEKSDKEQYKLRQLADDAALAYQRGEYLSALDLYKQLDEQTGNQAIVKWNIGSLYLMIKNPQMALKYYKEACQLNPNEERYKQALKQLEQNLRGEELQQQHADNTWQRAGQTAKNQPEAKAAKKQAEQAGKSNSKAEKTNVLLYYGIAAKHSKEGARIARIDPGSRAAQVGLKVDDLIMAVDGTVTTSGEEINRILLSKPPGARFQFTIQRGARLGPILF